MNQLLTITYEATNFTFGKLNANITCNYIINSIKDKITAREVVKPITVDTAEQEKVISKPDRITTYYRDEILIVTVTNIAHVYIECGTTFIVDFKGKKSIYSRSLESLFTVLDNTVFFKVNRQHIVAITAIERIIKCCNSLKLEVKSPYTKPIYVGKNKVSYFKDWLSNITVR